MHWLSIAADLIDPGRGPDQTGDFEVNPNFFFILLGLGFLIGAIGHLAKSRIVIAIGVFLIFAATVAIPIALNATN